MLVLTRKNREAIVISTGLRIVVIALGNGKVKLGLEAPADTAIYREEVFQRMTKEPRREDR